MKSIAIVGGGIGGLTLAGLLADSGWHVDVLERNPELPAKGSALGMWPDAMEVLERLDVAAEVRAEGHPQGRAEIRTHRGRLLSGLDARGETVMISRVALIDALARRTPQVRFGSVIRSADELDHDVVVGADGVSSSLRAYVAGEEVPSRDSGVSVVIGEFDGMTNMFTEFWGPGGSFGITPLSTTRRDWHAAFREPLTTHQSVSAASSVATDSLAMVRQAYADWTGEVVAAIAASDPASVLRYRVRTVPTMGRWYRENVVLLGDSVHAMPPNLGRGACETMLDAATLARELHNLRETSAEALNAAFGRYQRARRRPAQRIALASAVMCRVGMIRRGVAVRNAAMRLSPPW